jgi:hypothetical protein
MITTLEQVEHSVKEMVSQLEFPIAVTTTRTGFIELRNEYDHELIELPILESDLIFALNTIDENARDFSQET